MIAGGREDGRRVVAVRLVELVVIVLSFSEAVDDVSQQKVELRHLLRLTLFEVSQQLIDDLVLAYRPACAATVAQGMEDDLARDWRTAQDGRWV
jgi:hypothetical protein